MSIVSTIFSPVYFKRFSATLSAIVVYAFVLGSVLYSDSLPPVKHSKDFERALVDLSVITAHPHPFFSHENDRVRSYLLSRIQALSPDIEVIDDLNSTVKYSINSVTNPRGVYFEGTNILVKVLGSGREDSDAVLISAHFDSVATAPGVTDNGIGVVGALQLLEFLVSVPIDQRPRRTAIFNFNNDEENGLHGAYAYLVHPWLNLTTTFLNIEGAGAGGRPMLFRSTSMSATAAFIRAHPDAGYYHVNALSQDVFGAGVIKSSTDWSVYGKHMEGLDLAFYKNRAYYHTKFDTLEYAEGGERALQAMIETIKSGVLGLLNARVGNDSLAHKTSVHFDMLGRFFMLMESRSLFIINVVFLVVGPATVIILLVVAFVKRRKTEPAVLEMGSDGIKLWRGVKALFGTMQFWLALLISIAAQVGLVIGYLKLNPFIVHSHPTLVFLSILSLAYLSIVLSITALQSTGISATKSKLVSLASLYMFTWILLVVSTVYLLKSGIAGTYWVTIWNICSFAGLFIGLMQSIIAGSTGGKLGGGDVAVYDEIVADQGEGSQDGTRKYVRGLEHRAERGEDDEHRGSEVVRETEPTEITPLMHQHRRGDEVVALDVPGPVKSEDEIGWWFVQMILTVPLPALLVYEITNLMLDSLSQTLVDGSSALIVYAGTCILGTLILLPLAPFAHRMHGALTYMMVAAFVLTTLFCWFVFPFTQTAPMRVFFQQHLELFSESSLMIQDRSNVLSSSMKATTSITGLKGYVDQVVDYLPSSKGSEVVCTPISSTMTTCEWEVKEKEMMPTPGGNDSDKGWIETEVTRLNESSAALISLRGRNTRGCVIYFDTPVHEYEVREIDGDGWGGQVPKGYTAVLRDGVKEILLFSRTWDRKFEVEVRWKKEEALSGRVACEYVEYTSGVAGGNTDWRSGTIPAYEEVLRFAPRWVINTQKDDGLVEVFTKFKV